MARIEAAADQAIAACGGDARETVKALIVANQFLETDLEKLKAAVSTGYARGKLLPRIGRIGMTKASRRRMSGIGDEPDSTRSSPKRRE
jgi:hypothetical protein